MLIKAEAGNATDAVRLHRQGRDGRTVCLQTFVSHHVALVADDQDIASPLCQLLARLHQQ